MLREKKGIRSVDVIYFTDKSHEENQSVFISRNDRCDVCESYKYTLSKDEYDRHIELKDETPPVPRSLVGCGPTSFSLAPKNDVK